MSQAVWVQQLLLTCPLSQMCALSLNQTVVAPESVTNENADTDIR